MNWFWPIIIVLFTFILMEGVAWFTHKYVMHGFLWHLHKDHHTKENYGFFEKNDYFFLLFAVPGMILIFSGIPSFGVGYWIGIGITVYGLAYFLIHEVFIHQRLKWFRRSDNEYLRKIRKAHKLHHKILTKENGRYFGMLWPPKDLP